MYDHTERERKKYRAPQALNMKYVNVDIGIKLRMTTIWRSKLHQHKKVLDISRLKLNFSGIELCFDVLVELVPI